MCIAEGTRTIEPNYVYALYNTGTPFTILLHLGLSARQSARPRHRHVRLVQGAAESLYVLHC